VRDRLDEFGDAAVAVIVFSAPDNVAAYQRGRLAPIPILVDADRQTYRAYGLGRGSVWKVWGPRIWWSYGKRIRRGQSLQRPTEDTLQLGGDFVVGRDGTIVFAFRSEDPEDRPAIDALLEAVHDA
jgi:peroxiredoxin